jgi:hypothetical protein
MSQMVVTFDAFVGNSSEQDFVIKCVTFFNVSENTIQQFDFAPPFDWDLLTLKAKQQNFYLTHRIHGLSWFSGHIPHMRLHKLFKEKTDRIPHLFAKGDEPTRFLSTLLGREVLNLETNVMNHIPAEQLTRIMGKNQLQTMKCAMDHGGLDGNVAPTVTPCCFTRAIRFAEFLKVYNGIKNKSYYTANYKGKKTQQEAFIL